VSLVRGVQVAPQLCDLVLELGRAPPLALEVVVGAGRPLPLGREVALDRCSPPLGRGCHQGHVNREGREPRRHRTHERRRAERCEPEAGLLCLCAQPRELDLVTPLALAFAFAGAHLDLETCLLERGALERLVLRELVAPYGLARGGGSLGLLAGARLRLAPRGFGPRLVLLARARVARETLFLELAQLTQRERDALVS
jgi:hypothetical protein